MKNIVLYSMLVIATVSFAEDTNSLISKYAHKYNIDKKIISTLIQTESGFDKYAIGISTSSEQKKDILISFLKEATMKYKLSQYKDNYFFTTRGNGKQKALALLNFLEKNQIKNYGLGLMQISSFNLGSFPAKLNILLDKSKNIEKGVKILRQCYDIQKNDNKRSFNAIECYYKGTNPDKYAGYDYLAKFSKSYDKGDI